MATTPPQRFGVDFSNVRRQALYATPRRSTSIAQPTFSSGASARDSHRTPASAASTAYDSRRSRGGEAYVVNSGRKRSRGSLSHSQYQNQNQCGNGSSASKASGFRTFTPVAASKASTPGSRRDSRSVWTMDGGAGGRGRHREREREEERGYASPGTVSPPPLANSRWHLARGYDSPTAAQANAYEQGAVYSSGTDTQFKRLADDGVGQHSYNFTAGLEGPGAEIAGPLGMKYGNGRSSAYSSSHESSQASQQYGPDGQPSWGMGKALLGAAAGVAGFVFHFCTAGAFRGFQAGEGQRWADGDDTGSAPYAIPGEYNSDKYTQQEPDQGSPWHDSDFAQDDSPQPLSPSAKRPAKKMKSSRADDGGMQNSWIMVNNNGTSESDLSRAPTPSSKPTASPAALRQRARPGTHKRRLTGSISTPLHSPDTARPASSAALRSPDLRQSGAHESSSRPTSAMARRKTMGSVEVVSGDAAAAAESPLGKEGEKLVRQQRRRAREEDREIASMNRRLEEMIRQGREALGTRYEVDMLDHDL